MALIGCPECRRMISETASFCPNCGYQPTPEIISEKQKNQQWNTRRVIKLFFNCLGWLFGIFFLVPGLFFLFESALGGLCLIIISLLLLPPARNYVYSKTNKEIPAIARVVSIFILFIAFGVFAGQNRERNVQSQERSVQGQERIVQKFAKQQAKRETIPADFTYSIIDSDIMLPYKRSLDIRLNKKVSKKTLRAIALKLKAQDSRKYERTFICYYLPDMEVGAGAWATTHFNPELKVLILGLTNEQEEALKQQPDEPSREVIGSWLDERPFIRSRITIFRQNGKLFIENTYTDGSSGKKEIVEKLSDKSRTFREKERNSLGEFYLIDSQGNLQLWDQEGLISTAKKTGS